MALCRPTVSSRAAAATTAKSLSTVSLTKKTNALESTVKELKHNLAAQSHQRDETLEGLADKVDMLFHAFHSLADVVTCEVEDMHQQIATTASELNVRLAQLEQTFRGLESQGYQTVLEASDRRFLHLEDTCTKIELALYESQAELACVQTASENLKRRECEAAQARKSLEMSQKVGAEALKRLRKETSQLEVGLCALKEQTSGATTRVARDVQALAEDFSALRGSVSKQQSIWVGKLDTLQKVLDRQGHRDKALLRQRVDALADTIESQDIRTKAAIDSLLKNDDQTWCAVKGIQADQIEKFDQVVEQLATSSIECGQRHDKLHLSLRSLAQRLKVAR